MSVEDGAVRWQKQIREEFGGAPGEWAYSESPLIDGDLLVCTPGGRQATIVALNKANGELIWKSAVPGGDEAGYASPIVVEEAGTRQYVQFLAKGVVGLDARTGKLLWRYNKTAEGSRANIPTPVERNGFIYTAAGRSGGGLVKLTSSGDDVNAQEVYYSPKLPRGIGGSVVVGDYLYGSAEQGLICAEFESGEIVWTDRSIGACSLCYADGRLYLHGDDNNSVALVEASPERYRELGRFTPKDGPDMGRSKAWAYPVVANGRLYIRNLGSLWAYDVSR
jgi:outer membrane protein assembly factor BamB